jgi:hypothetical protein
LETNLRCELTVTRGLGILTVKQDVVTSAGLREMRVEVTGAIEADPPDVFLCDARRPVWAVTVEQLDSFFAERHRPIEVPAALLIAPIYWDLFRQHAWNMAQRGVMRRVFTDRRRALEWLQTRQALAVPLEQTVP